VKDLLNLTKFEMNPIIEPRPGLDWEVDGTFNPAAVAVGDTTHLLYRAVDQNRVSRLGYARLNDGGRYSFRSSAPVMEGTSEWEEFGCEDPRVSLVDGAYYITYTAFSRRGPRIALASTQDFTHYVKHGLIGPDRDDKDCVLFPGRVDGKVLMLHRLGSSIQIARFDNLESLSNSQKFWTQYVMHYGDFELIRPKYRWEELKVGVGPPPVRTDRGWLVIYHGVSAQRIYRAGALLLDLDEPTKILARTKRPILEPERKFEKRGITPNVVFPEGATIQDDDFLVYYGGADRVTCLAKASLDEFLDDLERDA
jgi:predicted GH43/DUF377 family glycosyl hydrolase